MSRIILTVAGALAIAYASPSFAGSNEVMDSVTPIVRVEPVILGHVQSTGTHSFSVATSQTETMTFEFDSRTVMPRHLADGTPVRIDFRLLENGDHFANRVTPIQPGSEDWNTLESTRASLDAARELEAQRTTWSETYPAEDRNPAAVPATEEPVTTQSSSHEMTTAPQENVLTSTTDESDNSRDRLPQTASELPLLLALGTVSVAGAVALGIRRRRRA